MNSVRLRRLSADFNNLKKYVDGHPRLQLIQTEGEPPERYQLQFRIRSLRQTGDQLNEASEHMVEISLPRNYPRAPPVCRMLTPVFHPNIAPHAICVGDHWSPGEPLWGIVVRIGEMLAYQSYNTKSPLNGEAARWVDEHVGRLPLDKVSMLVDQSDETPQPSMRTAVQPERAARPSVNTPPARLADSSSDTSEAKAGPPVTAETPQVRVRCPECGTTYRMTTPTKKVQVRCTKCRANFFVAGRGKTR